MSDRPQAPRLHHWVIIHQDAFHHTFRMRVPGGWLYRYQTTSPIVMAMEFVPDRRAGSKRLPAGQTDRRRTPLDD